MLRFSAQSPSSLPVRRSQVLLTTAGMFGRRQTSLSDSRGLRKRAKADLHSGATPFRWGRWTRDPAKLKEQMARWEFVGREGAEAACPWAGESEQVNNKGHLTVCASPRQGTELPAKGHISPPQATGGSNRRSAMPRLPLHTQAAVWIGIPFLLEMHAS